MASKTRYPYLAFVLDATTRALLLERFLPQHEIVVAHHVTLVAPGKFSEHQPFDPAPKILVYGTAQTPEVDTVAVQVNGNLIRPDGIFYHVTGQQQHWRTLQQTNDSFREIGRAHV